MASMNQRENPVAAASLVAFRRRKGGRYRENYYSWGGRSDKTGATSGGQQIRSGGESEPRQADRAVGQQGEQSDSANEDATEEHDRLSGKVEQSEFHSEHTRHAPPFMVERENRGSCCSLLGILPAAKAAPRSAIDTGHESRPGVRNVWSH